MPFRIDDIWKLSTASIGQRLLAPDGQRRECCDTSMRESYPAPNVCNVKAEKVYVIKQNTERGTGRGRGSSKYNKRSIFVFLILVRSFLEIRQQNIIHINY